MVSLTSPRPLVLASLVLACSILALYVGLLLHISIVYTHLFYIPIVLGGLWYPRRSLILALYLGLLLLVVEYLSTGGLDLSVFARATSFLLVAGLVGLIAGRIQRGDRASLQYLSSYAERVSTPRSKLQSTFDGVRMSLGMNMDVERMRERGDVASLIRTLDHPNAEVRYQVVDALGTLQNPASAERIALALKDPDCGVRWKAAEALGKLGNHALPFLFSALRDPSSDIRWRAALALGETHQEEAIPLLIDALADPDIYVRGRAGVALTVFGAAVVPPLMRVARSEENSRMGAIRALGLLEEHGLTALKSILQDCPLEESILGPMEEAFYDLGERGIPVLENFLGHSKQPALRIFACRVLGRLGYPRSMEPLTHARNEDMEEGVRQEAEMALKRLTTRISRQSQ